MARIGSKLRALYLNRSEKSDPRSTTFVTALRVDVSRGKPRLSVARFHFFLLHVSFALQLYLFGLMSMIT